MKKAIYFLPLLVLIIAVSGFRPDDITLKTDCSKLVLKLKKGKLNKTLPTASMETVKKSFTCYTGESEENVDFNCGGGVFFLDHDFYCYTYRDYIEVRSDFKGKTVPPIMGTTKEKVVSKFGTPALEPDDDTYLFKMKYGTLRVEFSANGVSMIGVHYKTPEEVELCR